MPLADNTSYPCSLNVWDFLAPNEQRFQKHYLRSLAVKWQGRHSFCERLVTVLFEQDTVNVARFYQCPRRDDELLCGLVCPEGCVCYGWSFFCPGAFNASSYPELRFLDAGGSGMSLVDVNANLLLVHLNLSYCGLTGLGDLRLPNLHTLDLSHNNITVVSYYQLAGLPNMRRLYLAANPLVQLFSANTIHVTHSSLRHLDLSSVAMQIADTSIFYGFTNLQSLNLSGSSIERVTGDGFGRLRNLRQLDLRGCPMRRFPRTIFQDMSNLESLHADTYKLCCPAALPEGFNTQRCYAPEDEISSCDALLRADVFRVFLSVMCILTVLGNCGSFVCRLFVNRSGSKMAFRVFVTHLSVSDLLMGVYLAVIGMADQLYMGDYLWKDEAWRNGAACQVAGFLCLLSCEVSAFVICIITLDRFLVLRFPFGKLRFRRRTAHLACALAWTFGLVIAAIPLFMASSPLHWRFYSQTGICIPLPVSMKSFEGQRYSFGLLVVFNCVLLLVIALGQVLIFLSIRTNTMTTAGSNTRAQKDLTIARRLMSVIMSDFICWFPIGVLGLLTSHNVAIPSVANVAVAIFALPVNSAVNPFLYSSQVILERRRSAENERLRQILLAELQQVSQIRTRSSRPIKANHDRTW